MTLSQESRARSRVHACGRTAVLPVAVAALLLAGTGCEVDPSGPGRGVGRGGGGGGGGEPAEVAGDWTYSVTNLSGPGSAVSCNVSGVRLTLSQTDSTFTGSYAGGTVTCTSPGTPPDSGSFGSGTVVNGTISGDSVVFDLDTQDYRNIGRISVSGQSMSGNATLRIDLGPDVGVFYMEGPFAAVRE